MSTPTVQNTGQKFCTACGAAINQNAEICPQCGVRQMAPPGAASGDKNKLAAGLLGIFLGGFGIHKFYLGQIGWGIVYLLFCWTFVPSVVGLIEGIIYLTMSDANFAQKYGNAGAN